MSGLGLHTSTVRFGPRIHGLEPDGPEPDIAMSGSSPSAAGMSGSGPQLDKNQVLVPFTRKRHIIATSHREAVLSGTTLADGRRQATNGVDRRAGRA